MRVIILFCLLTLSLADEEQAISCVQANGTQTIDEIVFDETGAQNDLNWVLSNIQNDKRYITTLVVCPNHVKWYPYSLGSSYSLYFSPRTNSTYDENYAEFIHKKFPFQTIDHLSDTPWSGFQIFLILLLCILVIVVCCMLYCYSDNASQNRWDLCGACCVGMCEGLIAGARRH
jgi:hypothetical protein